MREKACKDIKSREKSRLTIRKEYPGIDSQPHNKYKGNKPESSDGQGMQDGGKIPCQSGKANPVNQQDECNKEK